MLLRWFLGFIIGTLLIAATSPWFVRSYLPRVNEPSRGVNVLQPKSSYRWRSEGYATTNIGPWGLPGQLASPTDDQGRIRVALWGDSQAEGVCVDDHDKIAASVSAFSKGRVRVLPFARSGDDCNDWIDQIASIQSASLPAFRLNAHVFLVVEWSDWCVAIDVPTERDDDFVNQASSTLPAFVIQVARNVLTQDGNSQPRKLRFRPGPVELEVTAKTSDQSTDRDAKVPSRIEMLEAQLSRLRRQTDTPCVFLYAPLIPSIVDGEIRMADPDSGLFDAFARLCEQHEFRVYDLRPAMISSVARGRWPRGFHNGQFGAGHYNAAGNKIIARAMAVAFSDANGLGGFDDDGGKD